MRWFLFTLWFISTNSAPAAVFDITEFGATANDQTDDTPSIKKAFLACQEAGGGTISVPAGTYLISRQGSESPIFELPSHCIFRGEGAASVLKFDPRVNQSNFWRMLGASRECRNVSIRDLHLDGSNTFLHYEPGKTPEHNHGMFFSSKDSVIENITIQNCLIENFSGDGIGLGQGCRHMTIRDVTLKNFVRQGIQMGGGNGARDYRVSGCQDLPGEVHPGGSTIHVEHARGLQNVLISNNRCRHSILAGGVDGLSITDNTVAGRIVGNGNTNLLVQGNIIHGNDQAGYLVQLGYTDGLILNANILSSSHTESGGIYVWGTSKYNPKPSQDVLISGNVIRVPGRGVFLNGVDGGRIQGNFIQVNDPKHRVVIQRTEHVELDGGS